MARARIADEFFHLFSSTEFHERGAVRFRFAQALLHFSLRGQIDISADFIREIALDGAAPREIAEQTGDASGQRHGVTRSAAR